MTITSPAQESLRDFERRVRRWLEEIPDPEIPVVSIVDLGIVRGVSADDGGVEIRLAPTYSGCPATEVIEHTVRTTLQEKGLANVRIRRELSPPWTTDWISDAGREKLAQYGIAPPVGSATRTELLGALRGISCPRCSSQKTQLVSEFGSTPCKASYKCEDCLEPFEYFKCI